MHLIDVHHGSYASVNTGKSHFKRKTTWKLKNWKFMGKGHVVVMEVPVMMNQNCVWLLYNCLKPHWYLFNAFKKK